MPKLDEYFSARAVHGIRHIGPAYAIDAGRPDIALTLLRNLRCFRDDETGGRALPVVTRVEIIRRIRALGCPVAGQWRHDERVRQVKITEPEGRPHCPVQARI
jgi:hypothetical protein